MKKIFALALALLMFVSVAAAESIDLSSLSYDELVILQQRLNAEIVSRPEWKRVMVPPGEYLVGVDIPEGSYSLTCEEGVWGNITVYNQEKTAPGQQRLEYINNIGLSGNTIGRITLKKGNVFKTTTTVFFSPVKNLGF